MVEHLELLGMMYEVDESVAKTTNAVLWKVTLLLQVLRTHSLTRSLIGTTTGKQQGRRRSADVVMPVGGGVQEHTSSLLERGTDLIMHWCRSYFFQVPPNYPS